MSTPRATFRLEKNALIIIKTKQKELLGKPHDWCRQRVIYFVKNNMMFTMRKFEEEKFWAKFFTDMFHFKKIVPFMCYLGECSHIKSVSQNNVREIFEPTDLGNLLTKKSESRLRKNTLRHSRQYS